MKNTDITGIVASQGRPIWRMVAMLLLLLFCIILFMGLGVWQLQRLAWKQNLIATVDARVNAVPVAIPDVTEWDQLDVDALVYQHVRLVGTFNHAAEVQSLAVTELGSGYWVMTPLELDGMGSVLVNRGFVPQALRDPTTRTSPPPEGKVVVTGLLRRSEPEGGFLRDNDPDAGRWYSRDISAIAQAKALRSPVAPFFVDADSNPSNLPDSDAHVNSAGAGMMGDSLAGIMGEASDDYPRGGLTVVNFRNTHLVYALTWFGLSLLSLVGLYLLLRDWSARQGVTSS